MSEEFSMILSSPLAGLSSIILGMADRLSARGFAHSETVTRLELGVSPEVPEAEIPFELISASAAADWGGANITFMAEELTLDVVVSQRSAFLNIYVDVNSRSLAQLYRRARMDVYFVAVAEMARACRASGGLGGFNLDPIAISPRDILRAILNNPETPGYPADLGIVPMSVASEDAVRRAASTMFRIEKVLEYWVLIAEDFDELMAR